MSGLPFRAQYEIADASSTEAVDQEYPLSPVQRGFWTLHQLSVVQQRAGAVGAEGLVLDLRGPLKVDGLCAAVDRVEQRFDALRTSYHQTDDGLVGRVHAPRGGRLVTEDLAGLDIDSALEHVRDRAAAAVRQPFDLTEPDNFRAAIFRLAPDHHQLALAFHHIGADGGSFLRVVPEALAEAYLAARAGGPAEEERFDFARWARAETDTLEGPEARIHSAFWRGELRDVPLTLELPTDRPRGQCRSLRGERSYLLLDSGARDAVGRATRSLGVRPFDAYAAVLTVLLHRMTEQAAFTMGAVHANRRDAQLRALCGCFIRTLPLVCRIDAEITLADLLRRTHETRGRAFAHLNPIVDEVISDLSHPPDPARNPGYQVVLNYMPFSEADLVLPGLAVDVQRTDPGWTATDLSFDLSERPEGLRCGVEWDCALFDSRTAVSFVQAFIDGLCALPEHLEAPAVRLPLLAEPTRQSILSLGHGGGPEAPKGLLHEVALASGKPDTPALVFQSGDESTSIDFATLRRDVAFLAARIAAAAGPETVRTVALVVHEPAHAVTSMLATLAAGAAYIPVDPDLPAARIATMVEDGRPELVVADRNLSFDCGVPVLQFAAQDPGSGGTARVPEPEDPAYVLFTSGTTGRPKGVEVLHRNVLHQLEARQVAFGEPPGMTLTAHSFAFDSVVACLYWALASGGTLLLVDRDQRRDPLQLRRLIDQHRVQTLDIPPALYAELLRGGADGLSSLRTVVCGGEPLPRTVASRHLALLPATRLFNEYGPTETTVFSTVFQVVDEQEGSVPIGRPIHRTEAYVVDSSGALLPRGAWGELWLGGAGVAAGYRGHPALSEAKFGADPFALDGRIYRTGDRVRWDGMGRLQFAGRVDDQVQIRGHRVEPRGVAHALEGLAAVDQAAVVARGEAPDVTLHGYVVLRGDAQVSMSDLMGCLRAELPEAMVPASLTQLDSLPRAVSGKVDHARLPDPQPLEASEPVARVKRDERTQVEKTLSRILQRVLRRSEPPMVHDDFFQIGGTSLSAVRVLAAIHEELHAHLPLSAFVREPTVAGLAAMMHDQGLVQEEPLVVDIQVGRGDRAPFWIVHPVGGHVVFAANIAKHWTDDMSLLGIQAQGLDGRKPALTKMDEMASLYCSLIRERQPRGPYFLGGPSQGGLISLEIAQRLHAAGESVSLLALFDCWGPGFPRKAGPAVRVLDHLRELHSMTWGARIANIQTKARRRLLKLQHEWADYQMDIEEADDNVVGAILSVQDGIKGLADTYRPKPYPGRIHLFRAEQVPDSPGLRFDEPSCGWSALAGGGVQVIPIDASHQNMLDEPHVSILAAELKQQLDELQLDRAPGKKRISIAPPCQDP